MPELKRRPSTWSDWSDVPYLDRVIDVDAHEMVPSHLWRSYFGEASGRIAILVESFLRKLGGNDLYNPELAGDLADATAENVWNIRGTRAPSAFDFSRRLDVMDVMGIRRQMVFPSYGVIASLLVLADDAMLRDAMGLNLPEREIRALGRSGVAEYNDWAARHTALDPERIRCVGLIIPDGSVHQLLSDTREMLAKGIRAVHLPAALPPCGLSPADPQLDEFWDLLASRDVPVLTHVGGESGFLRSTAWGRAPAFKPGKVESHEFGLEPFSMATLHYPVSAYLSAMLLGGVFERHPRLRFGAIETGAHWFGPLADGLDMWARDVHKKRLSSFISRLPSEYMATNVRVTPFNNFEPIDKFFRNYPRLQDCYCFSTDYPHIEGGKDIKNVFRAKLDPLGDGVMEKFFVTNGEWLLP